MIGWTNEDRHEGLSRASKGHTMRFTTYPLHHWGLGATMDSSGIAVFLIRRYFFFYWGPRNA